MASGHGVPDGSTLESCKLDENQRKIEDYFKKFTEVTEGPNYGTIMEVLRDFKGNSGVNDIFIGIYNR